jgi:hypothetical protein
MPLSREFPKSQVTLFSGPTTQLSSFTIVACGMFRRIHVTFNDVIGSHHSRLSPRLTGTWYAFMRPLPIQAWNPTFRSPPRINDADPFDVSGFPPCNVLIPCSRTPDIAIPDFPKWKSHDTCLPFFGRSRSILEHSPLVSEV